LYIVYIVYIKLLLIAESLTDQILLVKKISDGLLLMICLYLVCINSSWSSVHSCYRHMEQSVHRWRQC